jgi:hypothetical protein
MPPRCKAGRPTDQAAAVPTTPQGPPAALQAGGTVAPEEAVELALARLLLGRAGKQAATPAPSLPIAAKRVIES